MEKNELELSFYRIKQGPHARKLWERFASHHYLDSTLANGCRSWLVTMGTDVVGFTSAIPMPSGTLKNAWREHRTVVLPDYQGIGFGVRISEWLGQLFVNQGYRFYSRSQHPRLTAMRDVSIAWRRTSKNRNMRGAAWHGANKNNDKKISWNADTVREASSHEFMGRTGDIIENDDLSSPWTAMGNFALRAGWRKYMAKLDEIVQSFQELEDETERIEDRLYAIGDLMNKYKVNTDNTFEDLRKQLLEIGQNRTTGRLREIAATAEKVEKPQREKYRAAGKGVGVSFRTVSIAVSMKEAVETKLGVKNGIEMLDALVSLLNKSGGIENVLNKIWTTEERKGKIQPKTITGDVLLAAMLKPRKRGMDAPDSRKISEKEVKEFLTNTENRAVVEDVINSPELAPVVRKAQAKRFPPVPQPGVEEFGDFADHTEEQVEGSNTVLTHARVLDQIRRSLTHLQNEWSAIPDTSNLETRGLLDTVEVLQTMLSGYKMQLDTSTSDMDIEFHGLLKGEN